MRDLAHQKAPMILAIDKIYRLYMTVIQLATEKDPSGADSTHIIPRSTLAVLLGTIFARGTRFEWYTSANGTFPVVASITGTPDATFEASNQWGMRSSQ